MTACGLAAQAQLLAPTFQKRLMDENVLTQRHNRGFARSRFAALGSQPTPGAVPGGAGRDLPSFDVRMNPGRTRHHHILDLVRCALSRKVLPSPPRASSIRWLRFFGLLRFPALNFLPVPEDVGVPRGTVQHFRFRSGQRSPAPYGCRASARNRSCSTGDRDRRAGR